jgi:histone deacetylase 1/2
VKSKIKKKFEMIDLGYLHYFLRLQVVQTKEGISLSKPKYSCDLLHHFHVEYCKPSPYPFQFGLKLVSTYTTLEVDATLYAQLVGILLYLIHTHLDISFSFFLVVQYIKKPHQSHWKVTKMILWYIWGIVKIGLPYNSRPNSFVELMTKLIHGLAFDWSMIYI